MPRLPGSGYLNAPSTTMSNFRPRKLGKAIMKSHRIRIPKYEFLPIRLRPWFIAFTFLIMLVLGFLGFTNFSHGLPLNDKILHFFCLGLATGVLYWVFDVEEEARRIWFWRHSGLIITGIICFFFGGIVSEIVQAMLPYKEFQIGDIVANLTGSAFGLTLSYHLERYYRHRREIARLYRPLGMTTTSSESEDEDEEEGSSLLPVHRQQRQHPNAKANDREMQLGNVWDETDDALRGHEIFAIGDDDDSGVTPRTQSEGWLTPGWSKNGRDASNGGSQSRTFAAPPKIVVTAPSTTSLERYDAVPQ